MKSLHLFEFEDQPWFPHLLREYMTDYLNCITSVNAWLFNGFAEKLKAALIRQQETHVIDLCSGGAGPLPKIARMLARNNVHVSVTLTDLYPNIRAFTKARAMNRDFDFIATPVDATNVPDSLMGFRTILNGFHHFAPEQAREILLDAARKKQGIAIMELVGKTPFSFFSVAMTPLFLALCTPFIRPFRLSRLVLTYVLPLIPLFTLWDGFVSCLRVYSVDELRKLTTSIPYLGYHLEIGTLPIKGTTGSITYVIGTGS